MTPPFPEICKKDLVVTVPSMPKDLILEKFLVSCKGEEEVGGGAGPNPTFSSSGHFSSIHILNIDLSLGYPPPQLLWEQVTNGSEAK